MLRPPPTSTLFPYTALPISTIAAQAHRHPRLLGARCDRPHRRRPAEQRDELAPVHSITSSGRRRCRSEEHTSELQSRQYLVCRLLLEKKKHSQINSNQPARA